MGITIVDYLVREREVGLFKIDVQGAEQDVLDGARGRAILLEVTFVSHYTGDATFRRFTSA